MSSPAKVTSGKAADQHPSVQILPPSAHDFFQKVYIHLKEGQLESAKKLLDGADATTHTQLPANKNTIWVFVGKEGLSNDTRAENLVKVLRKSKLFPDVRHDEFEKNRLLGHAATAMAAVRARKPDERALTNASTNVKAMQLASQLGLPSDQIKGLLKDVMQ